MGSAAIGPPVAHDLLACVVSNDAFRGQPVLHGESVRLEPFGPQHVDGAWAGLADPELLRLTGTHATFTREQVEKFAQEISTRDDRADWAIIATHDGGHVGEAVLNQFDPDNASANFRIGIYGQHNRGRGYGTQATRLVVGYAFDVVGLHRVSLEVYSLNPRAQHVYAKCGFQVEGRRRDALHWDGRWYDAIVMGILSTDLRWFSVRTPGIQAWSREDIYGDEGR
jgi:RimJ/RimL family protein N-acetyltransferase